MRLGNLALLRLQFKGTFDKLGILQRCIWVAIGEISECIPSLQVGLS
jgi:hypothetical protein